MSVPNRYLATKKYHVVPVLGLSPDDIKKSTKKLYRDREKIGHVTLLNLIAKSLGSEGGIAGYQVDYEEKLLPFMQEHDLQSWSDLIKPRHTPDTNAILSLDAEKIADRLFKSGRELPNRIFTGYNFDYADRYDDGEYIFSQWVRTRSQLRLLEFNRSTYTEELKEAVEKPDQVIDVSSIPGVFRRNKKVALQHLVLGGHLMDRITPCFNLRGDLLVTPVEKDITAAGRYFPSHATLPEKAIELENDQLACTLFRRDIEVQDKGWVDVIPYNENLIFLKGKDGEYDFVINGNKVRNFDHQIYAPHLKPSDLPRQMNTLYDFQRWYYFEYDGWHAQDEHNAEMFFYASGGQVGNYPGEYDVWKNYFAHIGLYDYKAMKASGFPAGAMDFKIVEVDGKRLGVSQLITIDEVIKFSNQNMEYFEHRGKIEDREPDSLHTMNSDKGCLPAAVTWFDACAYISHIENNYDLPVRLLKLDEYRAIRAQCDSGATREQAELLGFFGPDGKSYGSEAPYMEEDEFQALLCKYVEEPGFIKHESGLKFMDSDRFCEWLYENPYGMEAIGIRSKSMRCVRGTSNVDRSYFPAWSTGKYHYCKIGFRVCFEVA